MAIRHGIAFRMAEASMNPAASPVDGTVRKQVHPKFNYHRHEAGGLHL